MDRVLLVNRSTILSDDQVKNVVPALQAQVSQDFAPIWDVDAVVEFGHDETAWHLKILDHSPQAGVGGYHLDARGRVSGKVFAADAVAAGESWTIDASHELLEMLGDPTAGTDPSKFVNLQGRWSGYQCLPEACDAVESDALGYQHPGADGKPVTVSDFVTPEYFFKNAPSPAPRGMFDFRNHLHAPAPALLHGGYLGIYDPATNRWSQVSNFALSGRHSRRSMRRGRTAWAAQSSRSLEARRVLFGAAISARGES